MKKIFFVLFASLVMAGANAQLANTKWKITIKMDDNDAAATCSFGTDTLNVTLDSDGQLLETLLFTVQGDVFTIKKISGQSDCDDQVGKYKFEIKDGVMSINLVSDDCQGRAEAIDKTKWIKKT